jgi:hypothetical protein
MKATNEVNPIRSRDSRRYDSAHANVRPSSRAYRVPPVPLPRALTCCLKVQLLPRHRGQAMYWDGDIEQWTTEGKLYSYADAKTIFDRLAEEDGIASLIVKP